MNNFPSNKTGKKCYIKINYKEVIKKILNQISKKYLKLKKKLKLNCFNDQMKFRKQSSSFFQSCAWFQCTLASPDLPEASRHPWIQAGKPS